MSNVIWFVAARIARLRGELARRRKVRATVVAPPIAPPSTAPTRNVKPVARRRGRQRCACCGRESTHVGRLGGEAIVFGCEWFAHAWRRSPGEAAAMAQRFGLVRLLCGPVSSPMRDVYWPNMMRPRT